MDRFIVKKPRLDSIPSDASTPPLPDQTTTLAPPSSLPPAGKKTALVKGRTFQTSWVTSFKWIEFDSPNDKVFCNLCKEANSKGLLIFSKKKEDNFIHVGFSNWKKALERFKVHENSETHKEAISKLLSFSSPSVLVQLNEQ